MTKEQVAYLAKLANIQLDDEKLSLMADELSLVLDGLDALHEVDTEGVEPLVHVHPLVNVMRPDTVVQDFNRAELLRNAPACTEEAIVVPKTVG